MATLTINTTLTYPDNLAIDLRDTLCLAWEYDKAVLQTPTLTKVQFIQQKLDEQFKIYGQNLVRDTYKSQKHKQLQNLDVQ